MFDGDFVDHYNANGIAVSVDGLNWHPIWDSPDDDSGQWNGHSVDLMEALKSADLPGEVVQIRFQAYRVYHIDRFRGWDSIAVVVPNAKDVYSFSLGAGDRATLAMTALNESPADVELLDGSSVVLARGVIGAENFDETITDFVAPATGTCYARVWGAEGTDYSLVVVRNAHLSTEPHDSADTAQDISSSGVVLGTVGYSMDRSWVRTGGRPV